MSDCDGDGFDDSDDDGYVFDPNREYPREVDTNFVCVDASSLVPERLLKRGHDNKGVLCFLVRYQGFDEDLMIGFLCQNFLFALWTSFIVQHWIW